MKTDFCETDKGVEVTGVVTIDRESCEVDRMRVKLVDAYEFVANLDDDEIESLEAAIEKHKAAA